MYERIRVRKLASFAGKGGARIIRVYELLEIIWYDQKCSPFGDLTNVSHDL